MAKFGTGSAQLFLVDGFDMLASKVHELTGPSTEAMLEDSHGLGDSAYECLPPGVLKGELHLSHG